MSQPMTVTQDNVDQSTCSYQALCNAFKRIAAHYSDDEKTALFSGAAKAAYRLDV